MPNALMPDTSSYADPQGNALLARGYDASQAYAPAQAMQNIQRNQVALSSDQIALGRQKLQALNSVLGPIGDDPTLDNAHARIFDAVQSGAWTPDMAQSALGELNKTDGSPGAIKRLALQHLAQNANIDQQLQMMGSGPPQLVNTGSQLQPVVPQSGLAPGFRSAGGGAIPLGMSPEFDNAKTTWTDSNGVEHQGTNTQFRQAAGAGGSAPPSAGSSPFVGAANGQPVASAAPPAASPAAAPGGVPPAPAQAPAGGGSAPMWTPGPQTMPVVTKEQAAGAAARITAGQGSATDRNLLRGYAVQNNVPLQGAKASAWEAQPGQAPRVAGPSGAPAAPPPASTGGSAQPGLSPAPVQTPGAAQGQGGGILGPAPGVNQAATVDADASAKQFAGISAAAGNLPNMKATVANMESVLPQITTGPQAARWNQVKSAANWAAELATGKDLFDPKTIQAQDEFHNSSVKLAQQQFQALGGTGTDGQLASASGDVPNESLSNMSNAQLLAMNKGLIDAQQARASAAQAWKTQRGPASYSGFVDDWNKTFSPRAFQFNYLSPADRGTMLHSMSPQERAQIKIAYDTAVQRGWIAPQGAGK